MLNGDSHHIEVSTIPIPLQIDKGNASEVSKWGRVSYYLDRSLQALNKLDKKTRVYLQTTNSISTSKDAELIRITDVDNEFLVYIHEKMKDVLYGKGKSDVTGYQDEAGIAHSELLCWDTLGIVNFPNYDFSRHDLEEAYTEVFIDLDNRKGIDLSNMTNENLKDVLLSRKEGSETLAYYHAKSSINWSRLHNLPYLRKKQYETSIIFSKKKSLFENSTRFVSDMSN